MTTTGHTAQVPLERADEKLLPAGPRKMRSVSAANQGASNIVLFGLFGFRGNTANFHSPQNSFINSVLETRKGNPLSLGCLYAILARHAGMPVYGVNLPEHFLLAYCPGGAAGTEEYTYPEAGVAFYINAFNRGNILKKADIDRFLDKLRITPTPACFAPCTHADILRRALHNLSAAYRNLGDTGRLHEIDEGFDRWRDEIASR